MKSKFTRLLSVLLIAVMMVNIGGTVSYASDYGYEDEYEDKDEYEQEDDAEEITVYLDYNNSYYDEDEDDEITCYPGEEYGELPNPSIKGFKFKGWYASKSGGQKVTSGTVCSKSDDHSLYARWTPNKYNVVFNGNNATSGKMSKLKNKVYGKKYSFPKNKFKRQGYKFVGWNTKKNGKGKQFTKKTFKDITTKNKGTVVLYAQWKKIGASTTGDSNSGTNSTVVSGGGTVYWTPSGGVYHSTSSCSTLSRSKVINSGSISQSGKPRACKVCY